MSGSPWTRTDIELSARLHELVQAVGVERMSLSGVQRCVRKRARRRRMRRGLRSATLATVALFLVVGAWAANSHGNANRVIGGGPLVPTAPQVSPGPTASADQATVATAPPTTSTSVLPGSPTSGADPTAAGPESRDGAGHDPVPTKGGDGDTGR
jgi:hypothetical protein